MRHFATKKWWLVAERKRCPGQIIDRGIAFRLCPSHREWACSDTIPHAAGFRH